MVNFRDPYALQAFAEENDRKQAQLRRDMAERGPVATWQAPEPEPPRAPVRPQAQAIMAPHVQAGWDAWVQGHIKNALRGVAVEISNARKSAIKCTDALAEEAGKVVGDIAKEQGAKIKALEEQVAALQSEIATLKADNVLDMRGLVGRKDARDAA